MSLNSRNQRLQTQPAYLGNLQARLPAVASSQNSKSLDKGPHDILASYLPHEKNVHAARLSAYLTKNQSVDHIKAAHKQTSTDLPNSTIISDKDLCKTQEIRHMLAKDHFSAKLYDAQHHISRISYKNVHSNILTFRKVKFQDQSKSTGVKQLVESTYDPAKLKLYPREESKKLHDKRKYPEDDFIAK